MVAFDEPRFSAVCPDAVPSEGNEVATMSGKRGRSVRRVTMFREVMADCVMVLLLKVEYKIRATVLVLIRNNIKVGII